MDRARSFGQVAESYDRFRPGYPEDVYVAVVGPGELVLEAGAGTGIATEGLASRARRVDAIEPDAAMAAIARRRTTGLAVTVQESSFEECEVRDSVYDVVACAQAWHWINLDQGYPRAARALRPGGRLAVWWNRPSEPSGRIWDAIQGAYATYAPELQRPPNEAKQRHREDNFPEGPGFGAWTLTRWSWTHCYDAAAYRGYLSTHSDHLALPDDRREALLTAAARAIGRARFEHPYYTVLAVAHKTS